MKKIIWLICLVFVLASCGDNKVVNNDDIAYNKTEIEVGKNIEIEESEKVEIIEEEKNNTDIKIAKDKDIKSNKNIEENENEFNEIDILKYYWLEILSDTYEIDSKEKCNYILKKYSISDNEIDCSENYNKNNYWNLSFWIYEKWSNFFNIILWV